jgi:predicted metal-dependent phosphoesterase TrpH
MTVDLHLHSLVSDGDLDPCDLLRRMARLGVTHVSIADHDALGAYAWEGGRVFEEARRLGLDLTVGIELDTCLEGVEIHLLGYGVDLGPGALMTYLAGVQAARFERARREIGIVNALLGEGSVSEDAVFVPGRQTLMKPHLIHPLLEKGLFPTYEAAKRWYRQKVDAGIEVPKLPLADGLRLVKKAQGWAVLAHPGYYEKAGLEIVGRLAELQALGLSGVELDYPYHVSSPHVFSAADQAELHARLERAVRTLGLRATRGTDCHSLRDLERHYGGRGEGAAAETMGG